MNNLLPYRIISYILLLFAFILAISGIFVLLLAFANPLLIFSFLIIVFIVTYIFSSFIFLQKGINAGRKLKPKLYRNIKRTAYVALFFAVMNLFQSIMSLYNPSAINESINQMMSMQKGNISNGIVTTEMIQKTARIAMYIMAFFAATLLIHVYETFKFLKEYAHLFSEEQQ